MSSPDVLRDGEVIVYQAPEGQVHVDARLERETVWLTQQQMADLFGRERSVVTKLIRNAFQEGELDPGATSARFAQVRTEGGRTVSHEVDHYNPDVIVSVGYRVKSLHGTQFRIWATNTLRDHLRRDGLLLRTYGSPRLADNAMVALVLLIAESDPAQKDPFVHLSDNVSISRGQTL